MLNKAVDEVRAGEYRQMKEDGYEPHLAGQYLDRWCTRVIRSKIEPMKKVVKTIRRHKPLIMNWFKAKKAYSSGIG